MMHERIVQLGWDARQQSFTGELRTPGLDASLLLLQELGYLSASDPRFLSTISAVERSLRRTVLRHAL
mgnify:CR=1 FL=1